MKRWLFNVAAGMSLLLCVATGLLWHRSHIVLDEIALITRDANSAGFTEYLIESNSGSIYAAWAHFPTQLPSHLHYGFNRAISQPPHPRLDDHWGFGFDHGLPVGSQPAYWYIWVPNWVVMMVTASLPGIWMFRHRLSTRQLQRMANGQCINCGYDLRATPDRCPECGTIPTTTKGAAT